MRKWLLRGISKIPEDVYFEKQQSMSQDLARKDVFRHEVAGLQKECSSMIAKARYLLKLDEMKRIKLSERQKQLINDKILFYTFLGKATMEWDIFTELGLTLGDSSSREEDKEE